MWIICLSHVNLMWILYGFYVWLMSCTSTCDVYPYDSHVVCLCFSCDTHMSSKLYVLNMPGFYLRDFIQYLTLLGKTNLMAKCQVEQAELGMCCKCTVHVIITWFACVVHVLSMWATCVANISRYLELYVIHTAFASNNHCYLTICMFPRFYFLYIPVWNICHVAAFVIPLTLICTIQAVLGENNVGSVAPNCHGYLHGLLLRACTIIPAFFINCCHGNGCRGYNADLHACMLNCEKNDIVASVKSMFAYLSVSLKMSVLENCTEGFFHFLFFFLKKEARMGYSI